MRSPTESTPRDFRVLQQSVTAAAILLSTTLVTGVPIRTERLAQAENMSKPIRTFTRTFQERKRTPSVSQRAHEFIVALRQLVAQHALIWHDPTVSHDEIDHTIEISWWRENKALIITVEPDGSITFLRAWGSHIFDEMEDDENPSSDQLIDLWQWLYA